MVNLRVHPDIYPQPSETGFIPMPAPTLDGSQYAQMFTADKPSTNVVVPIPHSNNDSRINPATYAITCVLMRQIRFPARRSISGPDT